MKNSYRLQVAARAKGLGEMIYKVMPENTVFVLLVSEFSRSAEGLMHISNVDRHNMLALLRCAVRELESDLLKEEEL